MLDGEMSGFGRGVVEIFFHLGCWVAQVGSYRRFGTVCRYQLEMSKASS